MCRPHAGVYFQSNFNMQGFYMNRIQIKYNVLFLKMWEYSRLHQKELTELFDYKSEIV